MTCITVGWVPSCKSPPKFWMKQVLHQNWSVLTFELWVISLFIFINQRCLFVTGLAIQCYQCDSNEDASCPSNRGFDEELNAMIDCNSLEAHTPGTFCMKITQQSPGCK